MLKMLNEELKAKIEAGQKTINTNEDISMHGFVDVIQILDGGV